MYEMNPLYDDSDLGRYLREELKKITEQFRTNDIEVAQFKVWHNEPDKPRQGQLYYADGSDWNPLSGGEGLYRHTGSAWVKVG